MDTRGGEEMNQIEIVSGFLNVLGEQKKLLKHSTINLLIKCVNELIAEEERPFIAAKEGSGLHAWLFSDDTGLSSKYMAHILLPDSAPYAEYAHPIDAGDFGRCHRFLQAIDYRGTLDEMRPQSRQWNALVEMWQHFSELYSQDRNETINREIMELLKGVEK